MKLRKRRKTKQVRGNLYDDNDWITYKSPRSFNRSMRRLFKREFAKIIRQRGINALQE